MKAGLDSLKWSMNAADEEQFKRIMGVSGKLFYRALENVKAAWHVRESGGYKTGLYASSIKYEDEQLTRMEALLNENVIPYVDQHYWLPLYSMAAFATKREAELGFRSTAGNHSSNCERRILKRTCAARCARTASPMADATIHVTPDKPQANHHHCNVFHARRPRGAGDWRRRNGRALNRLRAITHA